MRFPVHFSSGLEDLPSPTAWAEVNSVLFIRKANRKSASFKTQSAHSILNPCFIKEGLAWKSLASSASFTEKCLIKVVDNAINNVIKLYAVNFNKVFI